MMLINLLIVKEYSLFKSYLFTIIIKAYNSFSPRTYIILAANLISICNLILVNTKLEFTFLLRKSTTYIFNIYASNPIILYSFNLSSNLLSKYLVFQYGIVYYQAYFL